LIKKIFVKFKINNTFKQNNDETYSQQPKNPEENPYQPMDFKNIKKKIREPKVLGLLKMFVISKKKTIS
jgi:hypothetical protein